MHTYAYLMHKAVKVEVDDSMAGYPELVLDAGDMSLRINLKDDQLERIEQACRAYLEGKRKAPVAAGAGVVEE